MTRSSVLSLPTKHLSVSVEIPKDMFFFRRTVGLIGLDSTKQNADGLISQIHTAVTSGTAKPYDVSETTFGVKYKYRIPVTEPNGKTKNVIAVYQIDKGSNTPRLITNYLDKK